MTAETVHYGKRQETGINNCGSSTRHCLGWILEVFDEDSDAWVVDPNTRTYQERSVVSVLEHADWEKVQKYA